jgi:5-methyltetrahydrofolate--homocysteine methyltransferase
VCGVDLSKAIVELRYDEIEELVRSALRSGVSPLKILDDLRAGLNIVGEKYHNGEYFLSELYIAAETMRVAMSILIPHLSSGVEDRSIGVVVIGSIEGDIHDFGKSIVVSLLEASGFRVHDLGVDVPPEKFVDEAQRLNADIIGISALLSSTQPRCREVVDLLNKRGLRERFKVIIGGTGVTHRAVEAYGVDAAVNDASEGLKIIKTWVEAKKG